MDVGDRIRRKGLSLATHVVVEIDSTRATIQSLKNDDIEGMTRRELLDKWENVDNANA